MEVPLPAWSQWAAEMAQIGHYGKGFRKWSLMAAQNEKTRLDQVRKAGEDPRVLKADAKWEVEKKAKVPSLQEVAEDYLNRSRYRPRTVND